MSTLKVTNPHTYTSFSTPRQQSSRFVNKLVIHRHSPKFKLKIKEGLHIRWENPMQFTLNKRLYLLQYHLLKTHSLICNFWPLFIANSFTFSCQKRLTRYSCTKHFAYIMFYLQFIFFLSSEYKVHWPIYPCKVNSQGSQGVQREVTPLPGHLDVTTC